MKISAYIHTYILVLAILLCPAIAAGTPDLFFDADGDGMPDSEMQLDSNSHEKKYLEIWLGNWDSSPFANESLFGIKIYFFYDHNKIKVDKAKSYANDTNHGGPFSPDFIVYNNLGVGIIQLEVANFNCVTLTDKILIFTLELQSINTGKSEIEITVDHPTGGVFAGGPACKSPHSEDCGSSIMTVNIDEANGDADDYDDDDGNESDPTSITTTIKDTSNTSPATSTVKSTSNINLHTTTIPTKAMPALDTKRIVADNFEVDNTVNEEKTQFFTTTITTAPKKTKKIYPEQGNNKARKFAETTIPHISSPYRLSVSPSSIILYSGGKLQFIVKTISDEKEIGVKYIWQIEPASTIGSTIDNNGLLTVGVNTTYFNIMETVLAIDTAQKKNSAEASFIVRPQKPSSIGCKLLINISSATVFPGDTINFSANNFGKQCKKGVYAWEVNSKLKSHVTEKGLYKAGNNDTDHSAIDIIIVKDTANNISSNAIITVLNAETTFTSGPGPNQEDPDMGPSKKGSTLKLFLAIFIAATAIIITIFYLRNPR